MTADPHQAYVQIMYVFFLLNYYFAYYTDINLFDLNLISIMEKFPTEVKLRLNTSNTDRALYCITGTNKMFQKNHSSCSNKIINGDNMGNILYKT